MKRMHEQEFEERLSNGTHAPYPLGPCGRVHPRTQQACRLVSITGSKDCFLMVSHRGLNSWGKLQKNKDIREPFVEHRRLSAVAAFGFLRSEAFLHVDVTVAPPRPRQPTTRAGDLCLGCRRHVVGTTPALLAARPPRSSRCDTKVCAMHCWHVVLIATGRAMQRREPVPPVLGAHGFGARFASAGRGVGRSRLVVASISVLAPTHQAHISWFAPRSRAEDFVHESIVGSRFVGRLLEEITIGSGEDRRQNTGGIGRCKRQRTGVEVS